ncbi:MAG: DUF7567 family protein [Chloroflexota bacterium]
MKLYQLVSDLACRRPARWQIHPRYALQIPGRELALPAGAWLLELPAEGDGPDGDNVLYRLADGSLVSLSRPLMDSEATRVDNPEAVRAMFAYRSLGQAAFEDWGVQVKHIDSSAPFRLIKCPLCWSIDFTSVDFAQVWCDTCNATFTVRHTAGDPGWVIETWLSTTLFNASRYLLPRTNDLWLTLVLKDSGDLLDLTHDEHCWRDDCTPEQVALTGSDSALRPGLHACQVGTLYDWNLGGRAPVHYDYNRHGYQTLHWPDGRKEVWPDTAFVRTSNLTHDERRDLEQVAWELEEGVADGHRRYKAGLQETVRGLLDRPVSPPYVAHRVPFPDVGRLREGEKFLLHRWLLKPEERYRLVYAYPVWLVVTAADGDTEGWRVVRDNLCPRCGHAVLPDHLAGDGGDQSHRWCRKLWEETGWVPPSGM